MTRNAVLAMLFAGLLVLSGCGLFPPYDIEFINDSSYVVGVMGLQDTDVSDFTLAVDAKKTVEVDSTQIQFMYTPAPYVEATIDSSDKKVTFTDK